MSICDGRWIKLIVFPATPEKQVTMGVGDGITLRWHEENYGDHGVAWIVRMRDGKEISRHNARFVETVVWSDVDTEAKP
jgi:hypothetical protein